MLLESTLERTVRILDADVPSGERWHHELLSQAFTELRGIRPAILDETLEPDLLALLAFRHFFRHAYAVMLDAHKVRVELERLDAIAETVCHSIEHIMAFLNDTLTATE